MGNIYFSSDTHFGQQRTLEMSKRPFYNVKEMDLTLLINWNKVVNPDDVVYHLGDFGIMKIRPLLNGKIVLVKGNYERNVPSLIEGNESYFEEIYEYTHQIKVNKDGKDYTINMAHEPFRIKDIEMNDSVVNLYGHTHKLSMVKRYGLNVGVDCHNFTPISLEDVLYYHNAILNYYDDNVFY